VPDEQLHSGAGARRKVITLPAEIDIANARRVGDQLAAAMTPGITLVIADLSATTFCDSSGIRELALAGRHAAAGGVDFKLVVSSAAVLRVIALTGLDRLLRIFPSLDQALAPHAVTAD
jgi:anti-sigma B factor antagonist